MALLIIATFVLTVVFACCAVGISLALLFKAARASFTAWRDLAARRAIRTEQPKPVPADERLRHA